MEDTVYMITQLDSEEGFDTGRRVFVLRSLENYREVFSNMITDKEVKGMYTTSREVQYT